MRRNPVKRAFTLIEILIVVVILGILAAIVIPQFTDASAQAMDASVRSQLQTIRSQIELFNVQNPQTQYDTDTPADETFWDNLVDNNYLQQAPRNPMQNGLTAVAGEAAPGVAWVWVAGEFSAVDAEGDLFDEGPPAPPVP